MTFDLVSCGVGDPGSLGVVPPPPPVEDAAPMEEASSAAPEIVGTCSVLPSDMDAMVRALK